MLGRCEECAQCPAGEVMVDCDWRGARTNASGACRPSEFLSPTATCTNLVEGTSNLINAEGTGKREVVASSGLGGFNFQEVFGAPQEGCTSVDFICSAVCDGKMDYDSTQCSGPYACNTQACAMRLGEGETRIAGCGKSAHMRPEGFERPCRKAIFTRSIFCMSLSGTAGPLRHRKDLLAHNMEVLQTLPSPRSHSCASSHVIPFSKKSCSLFVLLKRCRLVTGLFWGDMDRFACLFDVFYYSESTAMPTISTISDSGLDPEFHKHASYTRETWNTKRPQKRPHKSYTKETWNPKSTPKRYKRPEL